jgi:GAF domain-containing protein
MDCSDTRSMGTRRGADARLQDITSAYYAGKTSHDEARAAVADEILAMLRCPRVTFWRFDGQAGALELLCFAVKRRGEPFDTSERRLSEAQFGPYFDALVQHGFYCSEDAQNDPNLASLRESYLRPNGIRATLDAAFLVNGRAYGMVCCEETDGPRAWLGADVASLRRAVARLATLLASARDEELGRRPSLPMRPIDGGPAAAEPGAAVEPDDRRH